MSLVLTADALGLFLNTGEGLPDSQHYTYF